MWHCIVTGFKHFATKYVMEQCHPTILSVATNMATKALLPHFFINWKIRSISYCKPISEQLLVATCGEWRQGWTPLSFIEWKAFCRAHLKGLKCLGLSLSFPLFKNTTFIFKGLSHVIMFETCVFKLTFLNLDTFRTTYKSLQNFLDKKVSYLLDLIHISLR